MATRGTFFTSMTSISLRKKEIAISSASEGSLAIPAALEPRHNSDSSSTPRYDFWAAGMARDPIRSFDDNCPLYFQAQRGSPGFAEDQQGGRRLMLAREVRMRYSLIFLLLKNDRRH
ncbi:unnamed protein product [Caenorhabditis nigoni]